MVVGAHGFALLTRLTDHQWQPQYDQREGRICTYCIDCGGWAPCAKQPRQSELSFQREISRFNHGNGDQIDRLEICDGTSLKRIVACHEAGCDPHAGGGGQNAPGNERKAGFVGELSSVV